MVSTLGNSYTCIMKPINYLLYALLNVVSAFTLLSVWYIVTSLVEKD